MRMKTRASRQRSSCGDHWASPSTCWKTVFDIFSPNGTTRNWYVLPSYTNAVYFLTSMWGRTCQYPAVKSRLENKVFPPNLVNSSSSRGDESLVGRIIRLIRQASRHSQTESDRTIHFTYTKDRIAIGWWKSFNQPLPPIKHAYKFFFDCWTTSKWHRIRTYFKWNIFCNGQKQILCLSLL